MKLAIKGHLERGQEVIEILEMLGGINELNLNGTEIDSYYYIDTINNKIRLSININTYDYKIYTLEEFLEKFPYKVGDKVNYVKYNDEYPSVYTIQKMWWNGVTIEYLLDSSGFSALTKDLQPYKEETMEEKENSVVVNIEHKQLKVHSLRFDKTQLVINDEYELKQEGDAYYIVRKEIQYPKTYKECFNICFGNKHHIVQVVGLDGLGDNKELFESFIKLKICRDAYWKIAGEEMGLGKAWKPDWTNTNERKYCIVNTMGKVEKWVQKTTNKIFAFPTEEMRDAFYENFKELIENCKELL